MSERCECCGITPNPDGSCMCTPVLEIKVSDAFIQCKLLECESKVKEIQLNEIDTYKYEIKRLSTELAKAEWRYDDLKCTCEILKRKIRELEWSLESLTQPKGDTFSQCDSLSCVATTVEQELTTLVEHSPEIGENESPWSGGSKL